MHLEEILIQPQFDLPNLISQKGKFSANKLENIIKKYSEAISSSSNLFEGKFAEYFLTTTRNESFSERLFKEDTQKITTGINQVLNSYLKGSPSKAYNQFEQLLKNNNLEYIFKRTKILSRASSFYRLRNDNDFETPITSKQLFHIPFEKRFMIGTQRYSIPGYPCLYVADSLLVACKEMEITNNTTLNNVKTVRLANNIKLRYIDVAARDVNSILTRLDKPEVGKDDILINELFEYALIFPIIAACHSKIEYNNSLPCKFKAEYIMPQILLQWFKDNVELGDGIRYFSNRMSFGEYSKYNVAYNYVFPVKQNPEEGLCSHLSAAFNLTDVLKVESISFSAVEYEERINEIQNTLLKDQAKIL